MFDPLTVGKKASKFGYRKFGVPGALVSGVVAVVGYFAVRRKVRSMLEGETVDADVETGTEGSEAERS